MFSVGLGEIVLVGIVGVLVLKPAQMMDAVKTCRGLLREFREWRAKFDADQIRQEKEAALAQRIAEAAKVSDVSDLLQDKHDEPQRQ